jgi:sulfur carrier protein ThiS
MVDVEFNLMLVELAGRKTTTLEIGEKVSLMELIRLAGLNEDDVGMQLINKQWAPFESIVNDGDRVQLYPFLEGG